MSGTLLEKDFLIYGITNNLKQIIYEDFSNHNSLFISIKDGFIDNLAKKIVNNPAKAIIIGVCGESASGKTTLARMILNACLGDKSNIYTLLTMDDYYHDTSEQLKQAGSYEALFESGFSFDAPEAFNLELLREHIYKLEEGGCVYSPQYDFVTCQSIPGRNYKVPAKVVLVEGLFALNEKLRDMLDVAIYVHTPFNVVKDRWYKRAASRGKTGKAADMQFENVNNKANMHIRPCKNTADIVLSGLISAEYIEFMAEQVIGSIKQTVRKY